MKQIMLVALSVVLLRQLFVLMAAVRSRAFLASSSAVSRPSSSNTTVFFVVLPVLRETAVIAETIAHMELLADQYPAHLLVVTTEREVAEASEHDHGGVGTVAVVEKLAAEGKFTHLHYPNSSGLKGDQLNFAATYCASTLLGDVPAEHAFLVCYDADSRPPIDSLKRFAEAVRDHDQASVFHQSSRFELRPRDGKEQSLRHRVGRGICDGGALRANRFVLGFELPRLLNRSAQVSRLKRRACSYVYAHVTGHGLCVRLAFLLSLPFPQRAPLEDMQYSFYLGSRDIPMVAVPSLDNAAVPDTITAQIDQASRWFFGPARALRYLRDPATQTGKRATIQAVSALASAGEWLGCAILPPVVAGLALAAGGALTVVALAICTTYCVQLILTELSLGSADRLCRRIARIATCPIATILFGVGGFLGATRLLRGGSGIGKTERH